VALNRVALQDVPQSTGPTSGLAGRRAPAATTWPRVDGPAASRNAVRHLKPLTMPNSRDGNEALSPLLVVVCDQDQSAPVGPAVRAARRRPGAELVTLPGGHYTPFMAAHEQVLEAELSFLRRHLLDLPVVRPVVALPRS
jgi:pimeloyl-ACP methyl ester carboxylesterase